MLLAFTAFGQGGVIEFKVSKPDLVLEVTPEDSTFWVDKKNVFSVRVVEGKSEVAKVELTEGRIKRIAPGLYEAKFDTVCETVLRVIELKPNGKTQLAFSKPYTVIAKEKPLVSVCGVKQDSAVDIKRLLHIGTLEANMSTEISPAVLSFEMVDNANGSEQVYRSKDFRLTLPMKNAIRRMSEGRTLTFRNIKIMLPDRSLYVHPELTVFVIESDEYSIGSRGDFGGR